MRKRAAIGSSSKYGGLLVSSSMMIQPTLLQYDRRDIINSDDSDSAIVVMRLISIINYIDN